MISDWGGGGGCGGGERGGKAKVKVGEREGERERERVSLGRGGRKGGEELRIAGIQGMKEEKRMGSYGTRARE
jgi:hypothetical protein